MSRIIAILGADGSGKTTFLNELEKSLAESNRAIRTLKMPQFHLTPGTHRPQLSEALEKLGQRADLARDPQLKAMSLFLAMPLYDEATTVLSGQAELIISERHPLIDSIAYAAYYRGLLSTEYDWNLLNDFESIALVRDWARIVMGRWLAKPVLSQLPGRLAELFSKEPRDLIHALSSIYRCDPPDEAILITLDRETLTARLKLKEQAKEIHEDISTIMMLQEALKVTAQLVARDSHMKLRIIETIDIRRDRILQTIV
ncbi:MAG: hypothetical protein ABL958_08830 [Bdellovibrionia bacterium]